MRQGRFALDLKWSGALGLLGLFGPSGSGKTTVLEVIAGLRAPAYGRVALGSHVLVDTSARTWVRPRHRGVGYAPQDAALFPHMTVRQNVLYGAGRAASTPLDAVLEMLEVEALVDREVAGLSGGERQRIALARALAVRAVAPAAGRAAVGGRRGAPASHPRAPGRLAARSAACPTVHVSHDAAELESADHVLVLGD